jgi:hypothetical protein
MKSVQDNLGELFVIDDAITIDVSLADHLVHLQETNTLGISV